MLDFSSTPKPSNFLFPKELKTDSLIGLDIGPEAISVIQADLPTKVWYAEFDGIDSVDIRSDEDPATQLFTDTDISYVDLTFDTSNRPFVVYQKLGQIFIYWFDPVLSSFTQTDIASGIRPSCMLDIRYPSNDAQIIIAYQVGSAVKYRLGSERFTVEYDSELVGVNQFQGAYMGTGRRIVFRAAAQD